MVRGAVRGGASLGADLNCVGRHSFAARPPREGLCSLRDPATVHLDVDEGTGE
ncbi:MULTISPECIES: hypothetical protein [unclassified Streptomyces]|uniref:hypothetical protein n=1 Tax=unclassified Streptomyces TaxID=2593676 RepID=UPI0036E4D712